MEARPALEAFLNTAYVRGGVTGVGVITALAGLAELGLLITSRTLRRDRAADAPPPPGGE